MVILSLLCNTDLHLTSIVSYLAILYYRTFHLQYNEKVKIRGINAYRFRLLDSDFRPDPNYLTGNDTPIGLIYLGVLQNPEAPVYGCKPHFLDCDPSLWQAVEGISSPDRNRDDVLVDVEPVSMQYKILHELFTNNI